MQQHPKQLIAIDSVTPKSDFKTLTTRIRRCELCIDQLPEGVNPIFQASPQSKILIIGQAPGRRVHETSIPFNDPSGDRLRQWLGIDKHLFYDDTKVALMPMGFCFPGTGKSGDLPPRPECAPAWHDQLLDSMPNVKLTILIGQYAQKHYLKIKSQTLTETVKSWKDYHPDRIPLPHPSPRNNIWLKKNPWFEKEVIPVLQNLVRNI